MCAKSYRNRSRFDGVIRKIIWYSFLPHMVFVVWGVSCGISADWSPVFVINIMIIIIVIVIIVIIVIIYFAENSNIWLYFLVLVSRDGIKQSWRNRQSSVRAAKCEFAFTSFKLKVHYFIILHQHYRWESSYMTFIYKLRNVGIPSVNRGAGLRQGRGGKRKGEKMREMERVGRWRAWAPALVAYCPVSSESAR